MDLQRELAQRSIRQLDRHHAENLRQERLLAEKNRLALTKGLHEIAEAIEYFADSHFWATINRIADILNHLFLENDKEILNDGETRAMCRLYFEFDDSPLQQLSFDDVTDATSWWINYEFETVQDIESVSETTKDDEVIQKQNMISKYLTITKELELYWLCKTQFLKFFASESI